MAESYTRNTGGGGGSHRARRTRGQGYLGGTGNSSARSSALYNDDPLLSPYQSASENQSRYSTLSLKSTASRFSLNEQFATTRREIEFEYDDSSSILERSTSASFPLGVEGADDTVVIGAIDAGDSAALRLAYIDFYDLLCVARDPSAESIRRAYFRLFTLLHPDIQPPSLRHFAEAYFAAVQTAFETLLDPCRRLEYDLEWHNGRSGDEDVTDEERYEGYRRWHAELLRHHFLQASPEDGSGIFELGARFDAQQILHQLRHRTRTVSVALKPLDFEMSHSASVALPRLDALLRCGSRSVCESYPVRLLTRQSSPGVDHMVDETSHHEPPATFRRNGTIFTVRASIYGLLQDLIALPFAVLVDDYQPSLPAPLSKDRSNQLLDGRLRPLVTIRLQHELTNPTSKTPRATHGLAYVTQFTEQNGAAVVEIESDVLPVPAIGARLSKQTTLPCDRHACLIQVAVKSTLWDTRPPRLWTTLQRPTAGGMLYCGVDSGDWRMEAEETCRFFSDFTKINRKFLSLDFLLHRPPKIDLAYKYGTSSFRPYGECTMDRPTDVGLRGLDRGLDLDKKGSWTISGTAEPNYQATSLRYARDVNVPLPRVRQALADHADPGLKHTGGRKVRLEAELSSNSLWVGFLALRCLKRVGRFSKFGFEVGISTYSMHLSLYWSRLGRRISLPFLMGSRANLSTRVLFWTTLFPFASFAAWEFLERYRRQRRRQRKHGAKEPVETPQDNKRAAADQLTSLMSAGVQNRQKGEYLENGLVILSAKYGVKARDASNAWGVEEVADVTVAVAALVDQGRLHIPRGVRKSNILGFWDPSPAEEKALHVRYSYQSREATVEVRGDEEELVLPPR